MTVRYKGVADDGVVIEQFANPPSVYLDNWALDDFSSNKDLSATLKSLMDEKQGTLMVSWVTLLEASRISRTKQFDKILQMIDSMDFAFIEVNPRTVIDRENQIRKKGNIAGSSMPAADNALLENYFKHAHDPLKPFRVSEAFSALRKALADYDIVETFGNNVYPIIVKARADSEAFRRAKERYKKRKQRPARGFPYTEELYRQCIDYIVINKNMKMPNKEWLDFFNTIVPVAYSDFVLLDNRWLNFVRQTIFTYPEIARVYGSADIHSFLSDLENFKNARSAHSPT